MDYRDYQAEREEKSRKLIQDFANLVNGGAETEALQDQFKREHRTLQQSMFREILGLICMISKLDDRRDVDGRNEDSKKLAQKLIAGYAEIIKKEEKERLLGYGYDEEQAEAKANEYRKQIIEAPEKFLGVRCI
jgi:hypothetical protein